MPTGYGVLEDLAVVTLPSPWAKAADTGGATVECNFTPGGRTYWGAAHDHWSSLD
jgi:hypothetical protein